VKILLLTTETTHHAKFVESVAAHSEVLVVSEEKPSFTPSFATASAALAPQQEIHERNRWFRGSDAKLSDFSEVLKVSSINGLNLRGLKSSIRQDLTIVFGTSILSLETILGIGSPILNFHGGDPQHYRGLDSHLWCSYHSDWSNLKVGLHVLEPTIDTGPLAALRKINVDSNVSLEQLRAVTTELCVSMMIDVVNMWPAALSKSSMQHYKPGRYYSHMPEVLLERCRKNFSKWVLRKDRPEA